MEKLTLKDIYAFFKARLKVVLIIAVAFTLCAFAGIALRREIVYQANAVLGISEDGRQQLADFVDFNVYKTFLSSYASYASSDDVLLPAARKLEFSDPSVLRDKFTVKADPLNSIITIAVRDRDAETTARIANTIADLTVKNIRENTPYSSITLLSSATIPSTPVNGISLLTIVAIPLLGLIVGLAGVFLALYADNHVKNRATAEAITGLVTLGQIHELYGKYHHHTALKGDPEAELVLKSAPNHAVAEDIRALRAGVLATLPPNAKTILLTAPGPSAGKSFIAGNLATAFAENGYKTLLIDCDLQNGYLHQIFSAKRHGLAKLLKNDLSEKALNATIQKTAFANLDFIAAGAKAEHDSKNANQKMPQLLKILSDDARYDCILLAGAEIKNHSDTLTLATHADACYLICAENRTDIDELKDASATLQTLHAVPRGLIYSHIAQKKVKRA